MKAHNQFFMDCHLAGKKFHDCDNSRLVAFLDAGWSDLFTCHISRLTPDTHPENQVQLTICIKRNTVNSKLETTKRRGVRRYSIKFSADGSYDDSADVGMSQLQ